jgi:hypothetical protein
LAKGAAPHLMFAELLGKEAGYCKGKGRLHASRTRRPETWEPMRSSVGVQALQLGQHFHQRDRAMIGWQSVSSEKVRSDKESCTYDEPCATLRCQ